MKLEYDQLVHNVRIEYQTCNLTLRQSIDSQTNEIHSLNEKLRECFEQHRTEKGELDEQLIKDKYTIDACISENSQLRDSQILLNKENEQLYETIKG